MTRHPIDETFSRQLKQWREAQGINQPELARRMVAAGYPSYSQMSVKRTEEGKRSVPLSEAIDLTKVLSVPLIKLLYEPPTVESPAMKRQRHINALRELVQELEEEQDRHTATQLDKHTNG